MDLLELKVRVSDRGGVIITDQASTIARLFLDGVDVEISENRQLLLDQILSAYGMKNVENELMLSSSLPTLADDLLQFASAILAVQYMQYTSRPSRIGAFEEEVGAYLSELDPNFVTNPRIPGKSGEEIDFDFGYPDYEIYVEALFAPTPYIAKEKTLNLCMRAVDAGREQTELTFVAFYDDSEDSLARSWTRRELHFFENYLDYHIAWTDRDRFRAVLP